MGTSEIQHKTQMSCRKRTFTQIQDGGRRHLEYRKLLLFFHYLTKSDQTGWGFLQIRCLMHLLSRKLAQGSDLEMAAATILNFGKMWPFHYH